MAYEMNDNSGSLFKNSRKEKDTHPDFTGKAKIDGVDYWQSAWKKVGKDGSSYLSFSYKPMDQQTNGATRQATTAQADDLDGDFIPF